MEALTESHLIDAGGLHGKSTFDTKFIDLVIGERTQLRFYNTGDCFNVYIMDSKQNFNERDEYRSHHSVHLKVIKTKKDFDNILELLFDKEGVNIYKEAILPYLKN